LTLALGVAAATTVFSFVDAVLLRPLPYPEPSRLFVLWSARPGTDRETLSYPDFLDYRTRAGDFESMALYRRRRFNVTAGGEPERVRGAVVTADFLRALRITPVLGRDFAEGEDQPGQDQVVIVSERFWRRQLGGDAGAIGRALRVDGVALDVIGVDALGQSMVSERLRTTIFTGFASLALLLAAVGIYGVMAYLVVQRKREIALRIALGARRGDVLGGVIRHSLGLAAPGILLGLAGALAASRTMGSFLCDVPPTDPLSVAAACGIVALLVVGAALAPARRAADTDPMTTLRSE
jgi:hypothetical protein